MEELTAPDAIITLLAAIRTQVDVITTLSLGGLGVIILSWGRILGILDDVDLSSFKKPGLLIIPAVGLLLAVIMGYLVGAQTTGYYTEIASGVDSSTGKEITDARNYYFLSYDDLFYWMMYTQLVASFLGIVLLACWFAWNILNLKGKTK